MLDFAKVVQHMESRRERLLQEAAIRQTLQAGSGHRIRLPPGLAFALGDWLIGLGTRLKAPYQAVKLPVPNSERG